MPLPVTIKRNSLDAPTLVGGRTVQIGPFIVPGVGVAAAYTANDALGVKFSINVPISGIIYTATYYDLDDEGTAMDLVLFREDFTETADNAAMSVSDLDIRKLVGVINFPAASFRNFAANQVCQVTNAGLAYVAPLGLLYCQFMTESTPTIAVDNIPMIALTILPDQS